MRKRIGIVDLGTNTFHVLIAEVEGTKHSFIYKEKIHVALGKGGINNGVITDDALGRALSAITHIQQVLCNFQVEYTRTVATSALRNAANARMVINNLSAASGLEIEVISGNTEAEFIFEGISFGLDLSNHNSLVMDIGGGSVEFIIGSNLGIVWKRSFELGAQRIVDEFQNQDPIAANEIAIIEKHFERNLKELSLAMEDFQPQTLVGSSGTFDTFSEIYRKENNIQIIQKQAEFPLTIDAIHSIHGNIIKKDREQRLQIPGMVEMRVDLIVVASILIQTVLRMGDFNDVRVSSYSLKEGIFSQYLKTQKFLV